MPRGFVNGLFISSFGFLGLFYPKSKSLHFFCSLLAVIAYSINPNSVLLTFVWSLFLFFENLKNRSFYLLVSLGGIFGFAFHFLLSHFYLQHPFYNLHKFELAFSFDTLFNSLSNLDIYFNYVTPIFWKTGFLVLLAFPVLGIILFKQQRIKAVIITLIPLIIILMLGINKVHDGTSSVFFSYSRMFLSIPLLLSLSLACVPAITQSKLFNLFFLLPPAFFIYQVTHLNAAVAESTAANYNQVVGVSGVKNILKNCDELKKTAAKYNVQLIVVSGHWNGDFYAYGCPACEGNFPNTLKPGYERRTWRLLEDEQKVYQTILIIDGNRDLAKEFDFVKKIPGNDNFYLIEANTKYTMELLLELGIEVRKFR
jgi:hypothetical protein